MGNLTRFQIISDCVNKSHTGRDDIFTDKKTVEAVIKKFPLHKRELQLEIDSIIRRISLIIAWVIEEKSFVTLCLWETLLLEPHITDFDREQLEQNLDFLENWIKSGGKQLWTDTLQ